MLIVSYKISLKGLNILFLPPYYSETLGRFKYDVSGLFNPDSYYKTINIGSPDSYYKTINIGSPDSYYKTINIGSPDSYYKTINIGSPDRYYKTINIIQCVDYSVLYN
jgi:hypothetical protein